MSKRVVSVEGMERLQHALRSAAVRATEAAEQAVAQEVAEVGDDAEAGAPVRTGELRRGIRRRAKRLEGSVEATARHSEFVEHGTRKAPAQPFMQPAAERSRKRFTARMAALVKKYVEGGFR